MLLDGTITIVALPSIGADFRFSEQGLQWVLSAYALTFGGLLLLGGRAADLLGRRRVFLAGVLFFTAASLMCGLAWSPAALLAARVVQGAGAAIMTPTALSIISTTFTEGSERNKALGIWGAQVSVRGGYFPDVFFGLLLCGLGIGLAFVTATVAALAGVAEHEAGLASGLSNTALQIGTALGVDIVTTVAISRSRDYLAANKGANPLVVLTEGYRYAFLACAVLAGIGLALALLLPARPRKAAHRLPEPVPAASARD